MEQYANLPEDHPLQAVLCEHDYALVDPAVRPSGCSFQCTRCLTAIDTLDRMFYVAGTEFSQPPPGHYWFGHGIPFVASTAAHRERILAGNGRSIVPEFDIPCEK